MTNEFTKPDNDATPNYYGGGVPSNPVPPQPDSNPYNDPHYGQAPQQAPFNPAQQNPYTTPQQFGPAQHPYAPQANQANPYQQMPNYGAVPVPQNKNGIISLVTSLVTFFFLCWIPVIGTVAAIVGIVFGHKALKETKEVPNSGNGIAIAGTICGYVSLAASILASGFVLLIFVAAAMEGTSSY